MDVYWQMKNKLGVIKNVLKHVWNDTVMWVILSLKTNFATISECCAKMHFASRFRYTEPFSYKIQGLQDITLRQVQSTKAGNLAKIHNKSLAFITGVLCQGPMYFVSILCLLFIYLRILCSLEWCLQWMSYIPRARISFVTKVHLTENTF